MSIACFRLAAAVVHDLRPANVGSHCTGGTSGAEVSSSTGELLLSALPVIDHQVITALERVTVIPHQLAARRGPEAPVM